MINSRRKMLSMSLNKITTVFSINLAENGLELSFEQKIFYQMFLNSGV